MCTTRGWALADAAMGRSALAESSSRADARRDVRIERGQRACHGAGRLHLRTRDVSAPHRLRLCAARLDADGLLALRRGRLDVGARPRPTARARRLGTATATTTSRSSRGPAGRRRPLSSRVPAAQHADAASALKAPSWWTAAAATGSCVSLQRRIRSRLVRLGGADRELRTTRVPLSHASRDRRGRSSRRPRRRLARLGACT
jgi:hypothetical protein